MSEPDVELLKCQLDCERLKNRVHDLQAAVTALEKELKESNTLLLKSRQLCRRPYLSSVEKARVAARQNFMCASGEDCKLRALTPNYVFDESLWEVDHRIPFSKCAQHTPQLQALCVHCHSIKSRTEASTLQYRRPEQSDSEEEV